MARDPTEVVEHHLQCFRRRDLAGLLRDYDDDSVMISQRGVLRGIAQIRPMFAALLAEFAGDDTRFEVVTQVVEGDIAYVVWTAESPHKRYDLGSDTLVIRDGMIRVQTFAGHITRKG